MEALKCFAESADFSKDKDFSAKNPQESCDIDYAETPGTQNDDLFPSRN